MKSLMLRKVGPLIGGVLIRGDADAMFTNIATENNHKFTKNTLVFYRKKLKVPTNLTSCIIVTDKKEVKAFFPESYTIVYVKNVRLAFYKFIHYYRKMFQIPVIGVTGTCGKTTTKEMIAHILSPEMNIVKTVLSQNGLSHNLKYLLQFDDQTDAAVIEMGVNSTGHIMHTARYFRPTIGLITTIGTDHLQGFKHHHEYFREKERMLKAVQPRGTIILNTDDQYSRKLRTNKFKGKLIYIGAAKFADYKIVKMKYHQDGMKYILANRGHVYVGFVPGFGKHNVYNAVFSIATANLLGIDINTAIDRLKTYKPVQRHLEVSAGINNSTIIDDTWNTNPTSIRAALEVLEHVSKGKKSIAVLGNIEELGAHSQKEHQKIGSLIVKHKIDYLITIGDQAREISTKARQLGMNPNCIYSVKHDDQLIKILMKHADENTIILIKTSMRNSFRGLLRKLKVYKSNED
ncbi:MAG TPA: UDP-N-acetylmuramoyl-tripeptide--D-alanyl-D-alanine ligase [Metabacillus sp.]|nr:UDP-N-acetylmuramoyl-tripeptide--D-alanyl-D-alanine ligase [Metabacillus sp.]